MQWRDFDVGEDCQHRLGLCLFDNTTTDDFWLITQHINISFAGVTELEVNVTYSASGNSGCFSNATSTCSGFLRIRVYETNFTDEVGRSMKTSYTNDFVGISYSSKGVSDTMDVSKLIPLSGSYTGLYLALAADSGCISISRLVVFLYSCPAQVVQGTVYPETLAPVDGTSSMTAPGSCVSFATPISNATQQFLLECTVGGKWNVMSSKCFCIKGYFLSENFCIGTV